MSDYSQANRNKQEAEQALRAAKAASVEARKMQSKGRGWLCLAAFFSSVPLSLVESISGWTIPMVVAGIYTVVVGLFLLKLNYDRPSRQRGIFAADSFITFFTLSFVVTGAITWPIQNSVSEDSGVAIGVGLLALLLVVNALVTWPIVAFARRKTQ